jgi:alanine-glyoxylate transaminase/serine-glyoxylate transaminase/serine-pyruvate transaminase
VTLGIGRGMNEPGMPTSNDYRRIAHMGHVKAQAAMKGLGVEHGAGGLSAAAEALARPVTS